GFAIQCFRINVTFGAALIARLVDVVTLAAGLTLLVGGSVLFFSAGGIHRLGFWCLFYGFWLRFCLFLRGLFSGFFNRLCFLFRLLLYRHGTFNPGYDLLLCRLGFLWC